MKFRPLHDRVLVRRAEAETKTAGGIIIPGTSEEKPAEGEVIAIGTGYVNDNGDVRALDVKIGDRVLFSKWGGEEITVEGEERMVMEESKSIGVIA
ncbi:MAG: co-chaperone GroES [Spirochaetales bacterium]|nr:co-chaperone GroES [Spirochaetales bacterium]